MVSCTRVSNHNQSEHFIKSAPPLEPQGTANNTMTLPHSTRIALLATGGTIAGTANATGRYDAAQLDVSDLKAHMQALPDADALRHCTLHTEQLAQIDSKDMCWNVWAQLRQRVTELQNDSHTDAVVILHGSDTLEETAFFLHASTTLRKPVILTCSMLPADAPDTDGPRNMLHSILLAEQWVQELRQPTTAARTKPHNVLGIFNAPDVFGVCAGKAWHAIHLRKHSTQAMDAFTNTLHPSQAAAHWKAGTWQFATAPTTTGSTTSPCETHSYRGKHATLKLPQWTKEHRPPAIATLCSHACVDYNIAIQLVKNLPTHAGLLVEATGSGTIHQALHPALSLAQDRGITLARSTRCAFGELQHWPVPHSRTGKPLQWLQTPLLHSSKARVWLALELLKRQQKASNAAHP